MRLGVSAHCARLVAALAIAGGLLVGAGSAQAHVPKHKFGKGTSTNWSGYAIDRSGATQVIGTWTQPAVSCAPGENSWSSPWVGIDGDTSNTVEQTGTDSDCNGGTPYYYAWYEMYPKSLVQLKLPVAPGQTFTGSVTYQSSSFTLRLTNDTTGTTATETLSSHKAQRSSVEWIMEGPSNGLLSNFGTLPFTSTSATVGGSGQTIANASTITMVSNSGVVRAQPGPVPGSQYGVTWQHG